MKVTEEPSEVIDLEVRINARPETVFPYLIDPDRMVMWMGQSVNVDPRAGGIYEVHVNGENHARGEYVEVTPYSRVVFTFGWEGGKSPVAPGSSLGEQHQALTQGEPGGESMCVRHAGRSITFGGREPLHSLTPTEIGHGATDLSSVST